MTSPRRLALPGAVASVWIAASLPQFPVSVSAAAAGIAVLLLPGVCLERALFGSHVSDLGAFARWITLSVATIALLGLLVSAVGASINGILALTATVSLVAALYPASTRASANENVNTNLTPCDEKTARLGLGLVVVSAVVLSALAPNIARDRMWYLAFVHDLAFGGVIDWEEPFLATGRVAPRFAYNGWLLSLAAWAKLGDVGPPMVFERLAPPLLTVGVASAAWQFASRLLPRSLGLATLATLGVLLVSRYPFFSPGHYPFFARITEDKALALLVFVPVCLVAVLDTIDKTRRPSPRHWVYAALCIIAVGFSHGLVLGLLGITLCCLFLIAIPSPSLDHRRLVGVLLLAAVLVAIPARFSLLARRTIVDVESPAAAWTEDAKHPVVRAHLRMDRLRELPRGGPIVDPRLLLDPLLLLGLAGLPFAWRHRHRPGEAMLVASSLPFLALAFLPFVAPLFGKIVLPWMAYRSLWMIPFGPLLALAIRGVTTATSRSGRSLRSAAALALCLVTLAFLPWHRAFSPQPSTRLSNDADLVGLLAELAELPADARVAAAPGLAELVPAHAGRSVLVLADRATAVFAGSREAAETRLQVAAALLGLGPGSPRFRRSLAAKSGVTHAVLEGPGCGGLGSEIFRSGRLHLCRVRSPRGQVFSNLQRLPSLKSGPRPVVASLARGLACKPVGGKPRTQDPTRRWKRESRWSASALSIDCRGRFAVPTDGLVLRVAAELPRAREALVVRSVTKSVGGVVTRTHGVIGLADDKPVEVELTRSRVRALRLRLVPAYLPYLNLRDLSLLERGRVGQ